MAEDLALSDLNEQWPASAEPLDQGSVKVS